MKGRNRQYYEEYGEVFFITSTTVGFARLFDINELCDIFIHKLSFYQKRGDYAILAYVLMPNHFHLIIKKNNNSDISKIVANLKRITSKEITEYLYCNRFLELLGQLKRGAQKEPQHCKIWKPRFDCFVINNEETLVQKIEYVHYNPVKAGLVDKPEKWPYSSARNYAGNCSSFVDVDVNWNSLS
jgi:REP element-mobilizing transposase RayT